MTLQEKKNLDEVGCERSWFPTKDKEFAAALEHDLFVVGLKEKRQQK
jgi:hypothetical protein